MSYKTVCVAGGGVLGSQIAFQAAYCGFDVTIWLRSEGSIGRTQPEIDHVREEYIAAIEGMADGTGEWCAGIADSDQPFDREAALAAVERAYSTLKLELDLAKAVADADLVIESMAEDTQAKIDFYKKLARSSPQKTVVVTNSSTLLPSTFAKYTGRPEKYLSLHFANSIWKNNMTEVMARDQTDKRYFDELVDFANDIRMLALPVNKEKNGYLLNSMLVPSSSGKCSSRASATQEHRPRVDARHRRSRGSACSIRWASRQPTTSSCSIRRCRIGEPAAQKDDDALQF